MPRVHDVTLELVRPGPPHNQLLSPLTTYMALCGDGSPITLHLKFEHRQLLNRLERLRYVTPHGDRYVGIADTQRQAEVCNLGEEMGAVLAKIPSLHAELSRARPVDAKGHSGSEFVHLRLVLSGSELSLLPFELALAPQAYPGEGNELLLQENLPVVMTREIRRSRPLPVSWDAAEPRMLFVSAEPGGTSVPTADHARALRSAMDPWIKSQDELIDVDSQRRARAHLKLVKERLRFLPNASIEAIYEACASQSFTHVHILAHGDHYLEAGERRFGIALCKHGKPDSKDVVSGKQLAKAIRAEDQEGVTRAQPIVVTLATCDSGQPGSVLVPGGSIAHDLHAAGIPWVFASQFPLTKRGSVHMAEILYPRLLRGEDPRQILFELKRRLSMHAERDHDWASLVAYASLPTDFEREVGQFFERQTKKAIDVQMSRADTLTRLAASGQSTEENSTLSEKITDALDRARERLDFWESRIPRGESLQARLARSNCFGMKGSTLKRFSLLHAELGKDERARRELEESLEAYRKAMDQWVTEESKFNWTACQYLALSAVLAKDPDADTLAVCRRIAERDLHDMNQSNRAWAHGTLAELELIGLFHDKGRAATGEVKQTILKHCRQIVELMGSHSFHVESTRRQFQRYVDGWHLPEQCRRGEWSEIAKAAVEALTPAESSTPES